MREIVFLAEASPYGGYVARAVGADIFTEAATEDELREMARDAVRCHFEAPERPGVIRIELQARPAVYETHPDPAP